MSLDGNNDAEDEIGENIVHKEGEKRKLFLKKINILVIMRT